MSGAVSLLEWTGRTGGTHRGTLVVRYPSGSEILRRAPSQPGETATVRRRSAHSTVVRARTLDAARV
jgi:hypothetical protein